MQEIQILQNAVNKQMGRKQGELLVHRKMNVVRPEMRYWDGKFSRSSVTVELVRDVKIIQQANP